MSAGTSPESPPSPPAPAPETTPARPAVRRKGGRTALYTIIGVIVVVVILVAVGFSTNWYGLQKSSSLAACSSGITLQGDGAQIAVPLMGVWTSTYHSVTNNSVNYPGSGSGTGLMKFTSTSVDFAITDDPLTYTEQKALPAQQLTIPFVGGALAIIYNLPGISGHINLTGSILAGIYNGTITKWNNSAIAAINPGVPLPPATIVPVTRSDAAGTTYVLTDFLSQSSSWWATNVGKGILVSFPPVTGEKAEHGNSAVLSYVSGNQYTIGYSDLTDVLTSSSPPQYAKIENPSNNFILPTIASTESAIVDKVQSMKTIPTSTGDWFNVSMVKANGSGDYPIATLLYMYVYQATDQGFEPSLAKSQVIVQWLHWALSAAAQALVDETSPTQLYYAPLPAAIISVDEAGISTMTYNKAAIPACS